MYEWKYSQQFTELPQTPDAGAVVTPTTPSREQRKRGSPLANSTRETQPIPQLQEQGLQQGTETQQQQEQPQFQQEQLQKKYYVNTNIWFYTHCDDAQYWQWQKATIGKAAITVLLFDFTDPTHIMCNKDNDT